MAEKTVSELLRSMTADGLIMDKLERARHGFTVADVIKAMGTLENKKEEGTANGEDNNQNIRYQPQQE